MLRRKTQLSYIALFQHGLKLFSIKYVITVLYESPKKDQYNLPRSKLGRTWAKRLWDDIRIALNTTFEFSGLGSISTDFKEPFPSTCAGDERPFFRGDLVVGLVSPDSSDAGSTPVVGDWQLLSELTGVSSSSDEAPWWWWWCGCCFLNSNRTRSMATRPTGQDGCRRNVTILHYTDNNRSLSSFLSAVCEHHLSIFNRGVAHSLTVERSSCYQQCEYNRLPKALFGFHLD